MVVSEGAVELGRAQEVVDPASEFCSLLGEDRAGRRCTNEAQDSQVPTHASPTSSGVGSGQLMVPGGVLERRHVRRFMRLRVVVLVLLLLVLPPWRQHGLR